jgi:hypothetical protein
MNASLRARGEVTARWWPPLTVVAVIALTTIGGRVAATAIDGAATTTVGAAGGAMVDLPEGWVEHAEPSPDAGGSTQRFVVTKGAATAIVTTIEQADAAAPPVATTYVHDVLERRFLRLATTPPRSIAVGGVPGVRIAYVGDTPGRPAVEGLITVAVAADGTGLVLDAFAPEGFLAAVADDLDAMTEGATLG